MKTYILRNPIHQTIGVYTSLPLALEEMQQYVYQAQEEDIIGDLFNLLLDDSLIQTSFTIEELEVDKPAIYSSNDEINNYTLKHVLLNKKTLQVSVK